MGVGTNGAAPVETAAANRRLFRNRDFVVPYLAETQSVGGDQIGRVALSILVFDRTDSPAWTAFTYALTFLPAILGGFLLGGAGDRFPQVWVMVLADIARAALFLGVAIPGMPLPVIVALVAVAFFLGPAFTAAMVSRLAASLVPDQFRTASGIRMISSQTVQVAGFAVGGVIVAVIDARAALLINAATFAVSAALIGLVLGRDAAAPGAAAAADAKAASNAERAADARPAADAMTDADAEPADVRPADARPADARPADARPAAEVAHLWRSPVLRPLILMSALAGFFVVPEGLAVPVAHQLGAPSQVAGLLLAAGPLGSAVGAALLVKFIPPRRGLGAARVMSIACGVPLILTAALSSWPLVLVCWAVSGAMWAFQIDVAAAVVGAIDDRSRSRSIARASAVLLGVQGAGLTAFGAVGGWLGSDWAVTLAGVIGVCCAVAMALSAPRTAATAGRGLGRHALRMHAE